MVERIGDRLAGGAMLLWGTQLGLRLLQLLTTTVMARLLSPSDYGLMALAMLVVGLMDLLSNLQVGNAIIKTAVLSKAHLDTAFTLNMARSLLFALAIILAAAPTSAFMHEPRLRNVLYVLAIPALLGGAHNPYFLLFARDLNFKRDSKRDALASVLGSVTGITVAVIYHSYWALVCSSFIQGLTWTVLSYWRVPGRPGLSLRKTGEMMSFATWMILVSLLDFINFRLDYVLIGRKLGAPILGAYNVGNILTTTATSDLVGSFAKALFPTFSILAANPAKLRGSYRDIQSVTCALALPIGFGLSAVATNLVLVLVGRKWELAIPVITIMAPLVALQTLLAGIESMALALGKGQLLFWRTFFMLLLRGTALLIGFHLGGFMGILYARLAASSVSLLYGLNMAARITQGSIFDPIIASWRSVVSVAVMWAVLKLPIYPSAESLSAFPGAGLLLAKILLGAIVYICVHAGLWVAAKRPDGAERRLLSQAKRMMSRLRASSRPAT